jgi:hypothetical protein
VLLEALGFEGFLTMQAIRSPRNRFQSARIDVIAAGAAFPVGAFIDAVQGTLDQAQASLKLAALLEEAFLCERAETKVANVLRTVGTGVAGCVGKTMEKVRELIAFPQKFLLQAIDRR